MNINSNEFRIYMEKKLNFVADTDIYTRNFTRIYIENNQLYIGHTINNSKTLFDFEDMDLYIKYFDRI